MDVCKPATLAVCETRVIKYDTELQLSTFNVSDVMKPLSIYRMSPRTGTQPSRTLQQTTLLHPAAVWRMLRRLCRTCSASWPMARPSARCTWTTPSSRCTTTAWRATTAPAWCACGGTAPSPARTTTCTWSARCTERSGPGSRAARWGREAQWYGAWIQLDPLQCCLSNCRAVCYTIF